MNKIITLGLWQMIAAYALVLFVWAIVIWRKIPRQKLLLLSAFRMSIQLTLAGYVIVFLLKHPSFWMTILILIGMELFAIYNTIRRCNQKLSRSLKKVIAISIVVGTTACIFYFLLVVVRISPWYNPQYFIPIGGMLIGNSMTGTNLGVNSLTGDVIKERALIEGSLMLGATPKEAMRQIINDAFDASILPTINSMLGMGIVLLPGMMTGQILAGINPLTAIGYQIAVMLGILGGVSLSVIIFVQLGYQTFFNERAQLKI